MQKIENVIGFRRREKPRYQAALRRFMLQGNCPEEYLKHFGISADSFREWIEINFTDEMDWTNYGRIWDIDHRVPTCYFDFSSLEDLSLCWNYLNIRPAIINKNKNRSARLDTLLSKQFFYDIYHKTGNEIAYKLSQKVEEKGFKEDMFTNRHLLFFEKEARFEVLSKQKIA